MSSNINNFKQLQQEHELLFYSSGKSSLVEKGINQQISMLQFFGTVAELYLPVFVETILEMTKGNDQDYSNPK